MSFKIGDLSDQLSAKIGVNQHTAAEFDHRTGHLIPAPSSNPSATLAFCNAWLAAPLSRLSKAETIIACPVVSSTAQPMSQNGVLAANLISGICDSANTRTNGAPSNALRHAFIM